ncbi:uncharacterized protein [Antedon mediterranea]|uniref:uncharacterized protein n=1 Tax=Antedon mediterranea TaxID=105859 RepID=UPI003AF7C6E4
MAFVQDALNIALYEDIIDPEEYLLLYNLNKTNNLNVQYNDYNKFNLESYNDDECNAFFRFRKEDIYRLQRALQIEDDVKCVNGLKAHVHSLKFQSVVTPNGLIANLFGPIEGCRHDAFMLRESNLLQQLERYAVRLNGDPLCIYGDPAYPLRVHLQAPFKGNLTQGQQDFNRSMSQARVSVEWLFRDIIENWKFVDFKKTQKIGLSAIGKIYVVCCLLTNAHTCLYGNITSKTFKLDPPALEEYFR